MPDLRDLLRRASARVEVDPPQIATIVDAAQARRRRRVAGGCVAALTAIAASVSFVLGGPDLGGSADERSRVEAVTRPVSPAAMRMPPATNELLDLTHLQVSSTDRDLVVSVGGGFCTNEPQWQVRQDADQVSVRLGREPYVLRPEEVCPLSLTISTERFSLDAPLGERRLLIEDQQGPRDLEPAWRGRLLDITLPPGFSNIADEMPGTDVGTGQPSSVTWHRIWSNPPGRATAEGRCAPSRGRLQVTQGGAGARLRTDEGSLVGRRDINGAQAELRASGSGGFTLTWEAAPGAVALSSFGGCQGDRPLHEEELLIVARSLALNG